MYRLIVSGSADGGVQLTVIPFDLANILAIGYICVTIWEKRNCNTFQ